MGKGGERHVALGGIRSPDDERHHLPPIQGDKCRVPRIGESLNPLGITIFDPDHSQEEDRFITFGFSGGGRLLMVAHTDRDERIRIISARELTREEREAYEEEIQRRKG